MSGSLNKMHRARPFPKPRSTLNHHIQAKNLHGQIVCCVDLSFQAFACIFTTYGKVPADCRERVASEQNPSSEVEVEPHHQQQKPNQDTCRDLHQQQLRELLATAVSFSRKCTPQKRSKHCTKTKEEQDQLTETRRPTDDCVRSTHLELAYIRKPPPLP